MSNNVKKVLLKEVFNRISKEEVNKIKGGADVGHSDSCKGICTYDCFCEPHCASGINCTGSFWRTETLNFS
jgi:hypothetical protein